ncbi:MAG: hypothetical protein V4543_04315 [Bacteroidota bacterium]
MRSKRDIRWRLLFFALLIFIGSINIYCTRTKYTCSAYQSAFYFDKSAGEKKFALKMGEDSMPLTEELVHKTDVLLIAPMSRKKKLKSWDIVPMITVFPPKSEPDSSAFAPDSTGGEEPEEGGGEEDEDKPKPPATQPKRSAKPFQPASDSTKTPPKKEPPKDEEPPGGAF